MRPLLDGDSFLPPRPSLIEDLHLAVGELEREILMNGNVN